LEIFRKGELKLSIAVRERRSTSFSPGLRGEGAILREGSLVRRNRSTALAGDLASLLSGHRRKSTLGGSLPA